MSEGRTDVFVGTWSHGELPANIQVGADCYLERKDSFLRFRSQHNPGLVLGDHVKAYAWTEFNVEPTGRLVVGAETILVGAVFMCAELIEIGARVVVSYNVTIADSDFHPRHPNLRRLDAVANAPWGDRSLRPALVTRPVFIEDDVWIGIGAIILKGVRIGRGARIGAGAVVTRDVPTGCEAAGNPAQLLSGP
jgi:acetyltransferase-like isoleucine patch superfamily enzyme